MSWSHSVTIAQATHGHILFNEAELDPRHEIRNSLPCRGLECRFGLYIDDFSTFGTNERMVQKTYDRVFHAMHRCKLPRSRENANHPLNLPLPC